MTNTQEACAAVLRDLREKLTLAQRKVEDTKRAIAALEANMPQLADDVRVPDEKVREHVERTGKGQFVGMSVADAARQLLLENGKPMKVADITSALIDGGIVMNSDDKANTVGSILNRRARQKGDIQRVGRGLWAVAMPQFDMNPTNTTGTQNDSSEDEQGAGGFREIACIEAGSL